MKKYTLLSIALILSLNVMGQVGISNTEFLPNDNSMLEIKSGDATNPKGLRLPILDDTQETNITDKNTTLTLDERITQLEALLYYSEQSKQLMLHNGSEFTPVGVPLGGIIMWSGTEIPDGWALCDGSVVTDLGTPENNFDPGIEGEPGWVTPNLSNKFIVAYAPYNPYFDDPGNLSESKKPLIWEYTETQEWIPANETAFEGKSGGLSDTRSGDPSYNYTSHFLEPSDASHQHEFYPPWYNSDIYRPYYVLAFIMRVK